MGDEDEEMQRALAASLASSEKELGAMTAQEQDQLTILQMNSIVADMASWPMVGECIGVNEALSREYAENPQQFVKGIEQLSRNFLYRYLEGLVSSKDALELSRVRSVVENSKALLVSVGYEESAMEMFWEMLLELLDEIPKLTLESLHSKMNDEQGVSNHVVWFCRALSATQIKLNVDRFAPYIMDENGIVDVDLFCRTQVEPVNHECEQVQIIALTEMLQIPVSIEYLDGSGLTSEIVFPENSKPNVNLLYRPGHYDVLYVHDPSSSSSS